MQEAPTAGRAAPTRVPSDGRGRVATGIFLSFLGCFLLTTSRERPWTDSKALINSKLVHALTVVVGAGLVAWTFRRERRRRLARVAAPAEPAAPEAEPT